MRPLAPTDEGVTSRAKLSHLLMQRSIDFVHYLNTRQVSTPWDLYATKDFVHHYTDPSGQVEDMTAEQTIEFFRAKFAEYPDYQFEIVDTTIHLEEKSEKPTYATVWQTVVATNGESPGERERVAIYSWRRETDKYGSAKWVWWRQECPSTAALVPF